MIKKTIFIFLLCCICMSKAMFKSKSKQVTKPKLIKMVNFALTKEAKIRQQKQQELRKGLISILPWYVKVPKDTDFNTSTGLFFGTCPFYFALLNYIKSMGKREDLNYKEDLLKKFKTININSFEGSYKTSQSEKVTGNIIDFFESFLDYLTLRSIRFLCEEHNLDLNKKTQSGKTLWDLFYPDLIDERPDLLIRLLTKGAKPTNVPDLRPFITGKKFEEFVTFVTAVGPNIQDGKGRTMLHLLADPDLFSEQKVNYLLDHNNTDLNIKDIYGYNVLDKFTTREYIRYHPQLVTTLIKKGARSENIQYKILRFSYSSDFKDLVKLLGPNSQNEDGQTMLHILAESTDVQEKNKRWPKRFFYLLDLPDIDLNIKDKQGYTILDSFSTYEFVCNHPSFVEELIKKGARNAQRDLRVLILRHSSFSNFKVFVELLGPNHQNEAGETMFHLLRFIENREESWQDKFSYLLNHPDIDLNIKDKQGYNILDSFSRSERNIKSSFHIIHALIEREAKNSLHDIQYAMLRHGSIFDFKGLVSLVGPNKQGVKGKTMLHRLLSTQFFPFLAIETKFDVERGKVITITDQRWLQQFLHLLDHPDINLTIKDDDGNTIFDTLKKIKLSAHPGCKAKLLTQLEKRLAEQQESKKGKQLVTISE